MPSQNSAPAFVTPVVVFGLSPWGDRVLSDLKNTTLQRLGGLPAHCGLVSLDENFKTQVRDAITEVLNALIVANPYVAAQRGEIRRIEPHVVLVAAAAEVEDRLGRILEIADTVRSEFRRSHLDGQLHLLLYAGAVGGHIPADGALLELDDLDPSLPVVAFTDADAMGRRFYEADVARQSAQYLFHWFVDETVEQFIAQTAADDNGASRRIAVGIGRLDFSDASVHQYLRKALRTKLLAHLFEPVEPASLPALPPTVKRIDLEVIADRLRGTSGSVAAVDRVIGELSGAMSERFRSARSAESADRTYRAVKSLLLPLPPTPPPRPSWFARMLAWLGAILRWLTFRRPRPVERRPEPPPKEPPRIAPSAAELIRADRIRIRLKQVELALREDSDGTEDCRPLDLAAIERPEVRRLLDSELPAVEDLAWSIARSIPVEELLAESPSPEALRARIDALCDEALCLDQRPRMIYPDDCRELVDRAAAAVCPLFPDATGSVRRLALVPGRWLAAVQLDDCETDVGPDGEVVIFAAQSGAAFRSLLQAEDNNAHARNERGAVAVAPR